MYLNPNSNFLTVSYESTEKNDTVMTVNVYSPTGVKMGMYTLTRARLGIWEGAIPIKLLPVGNYYLRLDRGNGEVISRPFVKSP